MIYAGCRSFFGFGIKGWSCFNFLASTVNQAGTGSSGDRSGANPSGMTLIVSACSHPGVDRIYFERAMTCFFVYPIFYQLLDAYTSSLWYRLTNQSALQNSKLQGPSELHAQRHTSYQTLKRILPTLKLHYIKPST